LRTAIAAFAATLILGGAAHATTIVFTPSSGAFGGGVVETPWLGAVPAGGLLGSHYKGFGVDFTYGASEVYVNETDPPDAPIYTFSGVSNGQHNFFFPVDGRIVLPGTLTTGVPDFISIFGGASYTGLLQLSAYGTAGNLLGSTINTCPNDPMSNAFGCFSQLSISAAGIASFKVESLSDDLGPDSFGVREITLNTPTAIPEPGGWLLMILGFGAAGALLRARRKLAAA
jgi:hypothetical protein